MVKQCFETNTVSFKIGGSEDFEHKGLCVPLKLAGLNRNEPVLQVGSGSRGRLEPRSSRACHSCGGWGGRGGPRGPRCRERSGRLGVWLDGARALARVCLCAQPVRLFWLKFSRKWGITQLFTWEGEEYFRRLLSPLWVFFEAVYQSPSTSWLLAARWALHCHQSEGALLRHHLLGLPSLQVVFEHPTLIVWESLVH